MPKLKQETDGNAIYAGNAAPYSATIWERLSPETRREINRLKDKLPKEG